MTLDKQELELLEICEKVLKIEHYDDLAKKVRNLRYKYDTKNQIVDYLKSKE